MNKAQRVKAVMERKEADFVPAGFWFHYKPDFTVEEMIEEHLKLYRETDMDVIKIMQDYAYPVTGEIHCAEDWYHIGIKGTDSREMEKMTAVIRGIKERAGEEVLIFQTMFGPFKAASIAFGDDVLMKYSKEAPEAVMAGIWRTGLKHGRRHIWMQVRTVFIIRHSLVRKADFQKKSGSSWFVPLIYRFYKWRSKGKISIIFFISAGNRNMLFKHMWTGFMIIRQTWQTGL